MEVVLVYSLSGLSMLNQSWTPHQCKVEANDKIFPKIQNGTKLVNLQKKSIWSTHTWILSSLIQEIELMVLGLTKKYPFPIW
jgi:hypothetical protein